MGYKQLFAVRFIHSEADGDSPIDRAVLPVSLSVNAADGSLFTSDENGKPKRLANNDDLFLERYVGIDRPLIGKPSESSDINNGIVANITDTLNHLYHHTLAYVPSEDERALGGATVYPNSFIHIESKDGPTVGLNHITLHYGETGQELNGSVDYAYTIPEGVRGISPLRVRWRAIGSAGKYSALHPTVGKASIPNGVTLQSPGLWIAELVHDYGLVPPTYEGGSIVAYLRIEVLTRSLPINPGAQV